jgi:hypothetical protein
MAIDLFDTRTMLAALEQMLPPKSFLLDTFFATPEYSDTEYVDIDIIRGKRRLAPFVSPKHQGKLVERDGYSTKSFKPPYVKPKSVFTADDLMKRDPGQHIYAGGRSPAEHAAEVLGRDLMDLQEQIVRREEWMAAQALNGGVVTVSGEGIEEVIDFQMLADHKNLAADWSDPDVGNPALDIRAWRQTIAKSSGIVPNVAVLASDVVDAFLGHSTVAGQDSILNARRAEIGAINVGDVQESGATYLGSLFGGGIDLFGYDEWYVDDNGDEQPMVPAGKVLIGSTRARTARHYGAIRDLAAGSASMRWFPKSWEEQDPSARFIMLQSAPLVVPHQIDAFGVATIDVPS